MRKDRGLCTRKKWKGVVNNEMQQQKWQMRSEELGHFLTLTFNGQTSFDLFLFAWANWLRLRRRFLNRRCLHRCLILHTRLKPLFLHRRRMLKFLCLLRSCALKFLVLLWRRLLFGLYLYWGSPLRCLVLHKGLSLRIFILFHRLNFYAWHRLSF